MTLAAEQQRTAESLGVSVDEMNRVHDPLHRAVARWLGVESYALRFAAGAPLTAEQHELADIEEAAIMALQRWIHRAGVGIPGETT